MLDIKRGLMTAL